MLFNSPEYLFFFLPVAYVVYEQLRRGAGRRALGWLTLASLGFYTWWRPPYLLVLLLSLAVNYSVGSGMQRWTSRPTLRRVCFAFGVFFDLGLIVYYKYAGFLLENLNLVYDTGCRWGDLALPLGISFFTFQQIAYLHDVYRGRMAEQSLADYCLFVTFFPQLIAGPILHPDEILPQCATVTGRTDAQRATDLAVGLTTLCIGLFKKIVLADSVAQYATPVFAAAAEGADPTLLEAWGATLAYTLQLYFDFSGYSDMALGSGRIFGFTFPQNFESPYQAGNLIDFWRRWHMTLSRFLRDSIYIPLGGSRCSTPRRYANLLLTMLLGGVWHGAGWTYVCWGAWHGVCLVINHAWRSWRGVDAQTAAAPRLWARAATMLTVMFGWVLFRADSLTSAGRMYAGLCGLNGVTLPAKWGRLLEPGRAWLTARGVSFAELPHFSPTEEPLWLAALLVIVWCWPNTRQVLVTAEAWAADESALDNAPAKWWQWQPTQRWAVITAALGSWAVLRMNGISEFLYFQF